MKSMKFKTNAKCEHCVAAISSYLNKIMEPSQWNIDLASPDRILTVEADISPEKIIEAVENAGFKISILS